MFLFVSSFSFGQYEQYINLITPYLSDSIQSGFFYLKTPNNFSPGYLYGLYKQYAPDLKNNMVLTESHTEAQTGYTHYRYQQTYLGIPVEGAGCIEHFNQSNQLVVINAKIADSINQDPNPKFGAEEAVETLIDKLRKDNEKIKFAWEDKEWEDEIKTDENDINATWYPKAELIWAIDTMKDMHLIIAGSRYTLAYKIPITILDPNYDDFEYYIDASTGDILKFNSTHMNDGPALIYGYGTKTIDTQWKGGFTQKYILKTNDNGRNIHTKLSHNDGNIWSTISEVKDTDDDWGNADMVETSTHYFVSNSWDYFKIYFGRNGQDANGRDIRVRTQWQNNNAYFKKKSNHNNLVFGINSAGGHFGEDPSVVGHEFTHGVTEHTSGLSYSYESGALNESFSDIFGVVIQTIMSDNGNTDWIMGNSIGYASNMDIRSLKDTKNYGKHIENSQYSIGQPNTYNKDFWYNGNSDNGGVHINSGVQNKWFYILSSGENGINDNNDSYSVNGIGMVKSANISYYALTNYLMSSSNYSDSRQATITVAQNLYGQCSKEYKSTVDAWYAVGVGNKNQCQTTGFDDISNINLNIYPNPAQNSIRIEMPQLTTQPINIYTIEGKYLESIIPSATSFTKDLSSLTDGIYIIKFSFDEGQVTKKLILQR